MYKLLMDSIWDSVRLFQNNLLALIAIVLPFVIVLEIFDAFYIANFIFDKATLDDSAPLLLVHFLIQPFYSIAIVFYLSSIISAKPISITQAWLLSIRYWPVYLLLSIMVFTGLLLFIIPGLYIFIRLAFAEFYLLLEQQSTFDAIRSSLINTKDYFLILFGGFLIFAVFSYGPFLMIKEAIGEIDNQVNLLSIIISIIFDLITIIFTVYAFRIYHLSKERLTESS